MSYIDGCVAAVPGANKNVYLRHARLAAVVFKENGALQTWECWGDDVPEGKHNSFHTAVMRKENETVVFSWVLWPSKEVRDAAFPKIMEDPRMRETQNPMPFDGKRLIHGGFEVLIDG